MRGSNICVFMDGCHTVAAWLPRYCSSLFAFLFCSRHYCLLFGWSPPLGFICGFLCPFPHSIAVDLFDTVATILELYWRSSFSPQCYLVSESDEEGFSSLSCSVHRCFCAHLYRRYDYLVDHCQSGYMSRHLNCQLLELPLTSWTEHRVTFMASENCFFDAFYDDLIQSQFLPVLRGMGLDRHVSVFFWYERHIHVFITPHKVSCIWFFLARWGPMCSFVFSSDLLKKVSFCPHVYVCDF